MGGRVVGVVTSFVVTSARTPQQFAAGGGARVRGTGGGCFGHGRQPHLSSSYWTVYKFFASLSLTNLQVSIGGQNVLNSTLNMTYESFLEQVNLAEQLTSSDFGVSTGLISQGYWESSKWYFVNVERGNIADKLQPRNINVSFTNNSNALSFASPDFFLLKKLCYEVIVKQQIYRRVHLFTYICNM